MFAKLMIVLALLVAPVQLRAQQANKPPVSKAMKDAAVTELEIVIAESAKLDHKLTIVNVKAKAAALVALTDPSRAEIMFREIWKYAKTQSDKDFDIDQALTLILKQLFPRNPQLAREFLNAEPETAEYSLDVRATGRDPGLNRTARLAAQLADDNPRAASEILERALGRGVTPAGLNALVRLRERDALLSDFVVGKAMDGLRLQPDLVALSGLHLLSLYLFPEGNSVELNSSLQSLQIQYFSTTYDVLKTSLAQSDEGLLKEGRYTKTDLELRAMYQARMSMMLAALSPLYQPTLASELSGLASKLGPRLPDNVAQMAKLTNARLSAKQETPDAPELAIPLAIQSGDFEEAGRLVEDLKDEDLRKTYAQLIPKVEARALLSSGDVMGALVRIRRVEDQNAKLALYLEAVKAAQKKRDGALSGVVINEARTLIPQVGRNGLHVRALLAFASQLLAFDSAEEAASFLSAAVVAINSMSKPAADSVDKESPLETAWAELNDPYTLLDQPEFTQAFSALGLLDPDRTLVEARKLTLKPLQLVARLETIGEVMRSYARRPPKVKPVKPSVNRSSQ